MITVVEPLDYGCGASSFDHERENIFGSYTCHGGTAMRAIDTASARTLVSVATEAFDAYPSRQSDDVITPILLLKVKAKSAHGTGLSTRERF